MATKSTDQLKVKKKTEQVHDLRFDLLTPRINQNTKVATCKLRIPSEVPPRGFNHENDPDVVLELIPTSEHWTYCLKLMREVNHPNILCARAVMSIEPKGSLQRAQASKDCSKKTPDRWGLVEPYDGILYDYIKNLFAMPRTVKSQADKILLPASHIRAIIRQIIEGLEYLMLKGYYHGNFRLKNTYYYVDKDTGAVCVKLACFMKKRAKKSICQRNDVLSLANELGVLSSMVDDLNKTADPTNDPQFDTYQIDDLADKLKLVTEANMRQTYQVVKKLHCSGRKMTRRSSLCTWLLLR